MSTVVLGKELTANQTPTYAALADIYFSPYIGAEDLLLPIRALSLGEIYWLRNTPLETSKDAKSRTWRLSELVSVWLPLNYGAMVIQHEVFGHGYRIRDIDSHSGNVRVIGYEIGVPPPYGPGGGGTSYTLSDKITSMEETTISMAGVEATAILANSTKWKWLIPKRIDPRQCFLYLFSEHDISFYISSIKIIHHKDLSGHDINEYLFWLNLTYPDNHLSKGRLRTLSLITYLDPFTFYSVYALFHFISSGKDTKIPMIPIGKWGYLFGARLGLSPFGPEVFMENYLSSGGRMFYGYIKGGDHADNTYIGAGIFCPVLWKVNTWEFGLRADVWRQPKLLLEPGSVTLTLLEDLSFEKPLYPTSERHDMSLGASLSVLLFHEWTSTFGWELELGGKTEGFLPGYSLFASPTIRGGLTATF